MYSGTIMQRGYGVEGLFRHSVSGLLPLLPRIETVASTALEVVNEKRGLEAGKLLFNRKAAKRKENS